MQTRLHPHTLQPNGCLTIVHFLMIRSPCSLRRSAEKGNARLIDFHAEVAVAIELRFQKGCPLFIEAVNRQNQNTIEVARDWNELARNQNLWQQRKLKLPSPTELSSPLIEKCRKKVDRHTLGLFLLNLLTTRKASFSPFSRALIFFQKIFP